MKKLSAWRDPDILLIYFRDIIGHREKQNEARRKRGAEIEHRKGIEEEEESGRSTKALQENKASRWRSTQTDVSGSS
jgi:hypothetical protein